MFIYCECRKYADNTQTLLYTPSNPDNALGLVERGAEAAADWTMTSGLELNMKKTQVIILGSAHYTSSMDLTRLRKIFVNNAPLSYITDLKNIGVTMKQT